MDFENLVKVSSKTKSKTISATVEISRNVLSAVKSGACINTRNGCIGPYFPENIKVFIRNI